VLEGGGGTANSSSPSSFLQAALHQAIRDEARSESDWQAFRLIAAMASDRFAEKAPIVATGASCRGWRISCAAVSKSRECCVRVTTRLANAVGLEAGR
jgi:hypothetical protein